MKCKIWGLGFGFRVWSFDFILALDIPNVLWSVVDQAKKIKVWRRMINQKINVIRGTGQHTQMGYHPVRYPASQSVILLYIYKVFLSSGAGYTC